MNFKKLNKFTVIHPILFAIYPIIFLFSVNVNSVFPEEIIFPLFFVVVVTSLIWIALGFLLKSRIKSGFIVSIGLVLFFSYGHIYILLDELRMDSDLSHFVLIIPGLVLVALGSYFIIRTKKSLINPTKIVNVIAVSLVIISLLGAGEYLFTYGPYNEILSEGPLESSIEPTSTENFPDVYYIILDGYAGSKSLQTILNYDNSEFTDFLINKGFYIATESYSNYRGTRISLATTLNMNYLNDLSEIKGIDLTEGIELLKISRNNEVVKNFKSKGYTIYAIEAGSWSTNLLKNIDFKFCTLKNHAVSDFNMMLIRTSILNPIHVELFSDEKRDRILCAFTELSKMALRDDSPKFVLAHLMIPHKPFLFGANGEPLKPKILTLNDDEKKVWDADRYLGQLKFANLRMKEVISKLTDTNDPPVIIIQSDHGMRGGKIQDTYEYEYVLRTFNNFKAYYFPKVGQNIEFETTTPINSFRVLFNLYLGYEYDLLEDRIYLTPLRNPDQFIDIAEILIKNNTMD